MEIGARRAINMTKTKNNINEKSTDLNIRVDEYYPQFVELAAEHYLNASENSKELIRELESMFRKYPDGFAKHFSPAFDQNRLYGKCWSVILNTTRYFFEKDFKQIGAWYKSQEEFENADGDKFQGKFYCRVQVKEDNHRTYFYRNDVLIKKCIQEIVSLENKGEMALGE